MSTGTATDAPPVEPVIGSVPDNQSFERDLNALVKEQFDLLHADTRSATEAVKKYQEDARSRINEYQQRMFKADPMDAAPLVVRIAMQFVQQKLLAMPALAPYVVQFVKEKIEAVGKATKDALGPLPELDQAAIDEMLRAAGVNQPLKKNPPAP